MSVDWNDTDESVSLWYTNFRQMKPLNQAELFSLTY